jgi:hypothetical protein
MKIPMKTILRLHLRLVIIAVIKKIMTRTGNDMEKLEPSFHCW